MKMNHDSMNALNLNNLQAVHDSVKRAMSAIHEAEMVLKDCNVIDEDTMVNEWMELYQVYREAEKTAKAKGWSRAVRGF
jgi:chaperonin cofactor prefoldin